MSVAQANDVTGNFNTGRESNMRLQESGTPHIIHRRQPVRPLHHRELLSGGPHFVLNQVLDIGN